MNYQITYSQDQVTEYVWYNADIISIDTYVSNSLLCDTLSADTLSFIVKETDILTSNYTYGAPVVIKKDDVDGNSYDTLVGKFYLSSIERLKLDQWQFTCVSSVGLLTKMDYKGGVYFNQSVGTLIDDILADTGITYTVAANIRSLVVSGLIKYSKKRDALQSVLFAVGASVYKDSAGDISITYNDSLEPIIIPTEHIFEGGTFSTSGKVTSVSVTEHTYYVPDPLPAVEELYKHSGVAATNALVIFDEPVIVSTIEGTSGITFIEKGNNYVIFSGSGTISGVRYSHQQNIVSWSDGSNDTENNVSVTDAYLVSGINSSEVLERVKNYHVNATEVDCGIVLADEKPGRLVLFTDPFGGTVTGYIADMDISTSHIMKADTKLITNWRPSQPGTQFDAYVEYSSTGTYSMPSDYAAGTPVRFLICQAGHGGMGGTAGQAGSEADRSTDPASYPDNPVSEHPPGDGGDGGSAGTAREEGVYVKSLDLDSLPSTYGITVGVGGSGGAAVGYGATQIDGSLGTHSTLTLEGTTYTSAAGTEITGGFINALTGEMYGKAGRDGIDGGAGGKGGENNRAGSTGEAVVYEATTYQGGQGGSKAEGYSGGGGGGAAYGATGHGGFTPSKYNTAGTIIYTGNGGNGAAAYAWPAHTGFCHSGNGGCGGGGGGGEGFSYNWVSPSGSKTAQRRVNPAVGSGGTGSAGQSGAGGLVLLYYNKSATPPGVSAIIRVSGPGSSDTVTATDGTTVKTAVYQSGLHIFTGMTAGTWTISCTGYIDGTVVVVESTIYDITLEEAGTDAYIRVNAPATGLNIVAYNTVTEVTTSLTYLSEGLYGADVDPGNYTLSSIDYSEAEFTVEAGQTASFTWIYADVVVSGPGSSATNVKATLGAKELSGQWSYATQAWYIYGLKSGTWTISADDFQSATLTVAVSTEYTKTLVPAIPTINTNFSSKGDTWSEVGLNATVTYSANGAMASEMAAGSAIGTLHPPTNKLDSKVWDGGYINIPWPATGDWEVEVQLYNTTAAANRTGGPTFEMVDSNGTTVLYAYLADGRTDVFANYTGALNSDGSIYYASNSGGTGSSQQTKTYTYKFHYEGGTLTVYRDNVQTYTGAAVLPAVANLRCWYTQCEYTTGNPSRTSPQYWKSLKAGPVV